jgi:hypothetical protein
VGKNSRRRCGKPPLMEAIPGGENPHYCPSGENPHVLYISGHSPTLGASRGASAA